MSQEGLLRVIESVYAASLDPARIDAMLTQLAAWLGTGAADFYIQENGDIRLATVTGLPEDRFRDYVEHYHRLNPRLTYTLDRKEGEVVSDHDYLTNQQIRMSPYFQEFLASTEYREFLGFVLIRDGNWFVGGGVHFPSRHAAPDWGEYRRLEMLIPHLRRSSQILLRLTKSHVLANQWLQALDHLPFGVMLVDERASIIRMNQTAERIVNKRDGLTVCRRQLRAAKSQQTVQLQEAIYRAAQTASGKGVGSGGALALERPSLLSPLSVIVAPLPFMPELLLEAGARAILFVVDPEEEPRCSQEVLAQLFNLTPAECRLVSLLLRNPSLSYVVDQLKISRETARNQLKSILWKTGTHRQGELMTLILRSPAGLLFAEEGSKKSADAR